MDGRRSYLNQTLSMLPTAKGYDSPSLLLASHQKCYKRGSRFGCSAITGGEPMKRSWVSSLGRALPT
ncbi:hypothetical protein MPNT_10057 [Candidatus Methylacidithermus pantelleriae]|uniref:Uncharacterized protein n=1 Tax=Candidatus Methylacidithermus pantelleriae TaxID=2744239 RepID=A0A8J2BJY4_9BACT|nr:hypothetical protein MPNT_10057 [Candidatus Methylacidithermus pantelleriae]